MGKVVQPALPPGAGEITFDVERFELTEDRLEVAGRWFGVRGRRFMRPSLTLLADGFETRLLADLAHKPWAAEDGELWEAAFPSTDGWGDTHEAELTVAPDLTIPLAVPGARRRQARPPQRHHGQREHAEGPPRRPRARPDRERAARDETATLRKRVGRLTAELEQARGASESRLAEAQRETAAALAARDEALAARDDAVATRDDAVAARDDALRERETVADERDEARRERDAAIAELEDAIRARDAALHERDSGVGERTAALHARDAAIQDRDAILRARDQAIAERDRHAAELDQLRRQSNQRGAAMVMRSAAIDRARGGQRESRALALAIGGVCLLIVVLIAALLFGLH